LTEQVFRELRGGMRQAALQDGRSRVKRAAGKKVARENIWRATTGKKSPHRVIDNRSEKMP